MFPMRVLNISDLCKRNCNMKNLFSISHHTWILYSFCVDSHMSSYLFTQSDSYHSRSKRVWVQHCPGFGGYGIISVQSWGHQHWGTSWACPVLLQGQGLRHLRAAGWQIPSAQAPSANFISSQLGCHPHLLEVLQPCNCLLPLRIMPHLSNWIMLHFVLLVLDTFSSHSQSSWVK